MSVTLQPVASQDIEKESFRIITEELGVHSFDEQQFKIVQRVIHATGDFAFADNIRFADGAIERGINALHQGKAILTDVTMVASGISKGMLAAWGNEVICRIGDDRVARLAKEQGTTRAEMAMRTTLSEDIGIIAIGNAPTALLEVMRILKGKPEDELPLIIGIPVGFVNAAESKALLASSPLPFITSLGRKGGSPVAAATVNALIRLAA